MHELLTNLHMHTPYSDGAWLHAQIAEAALRAGLDVIIVTDHNIWVQGMEGYVEQEGRRVLLLVGEELHDVTRQPQANHLLVYGAGRELAREAHDPQGLINAANATGGLTFVAHPYDYAAPLFFEPGIPWVSWKAQGYTGIELWNYMTEFKSLLKSRAAALRYAFNPELGINGPFADTLKKWDELTATGQRVVAIGGADAHGTEYQQGSLKRVIFPYEFLFRQVNTHVFVEAPLSGNVDSDRVAVLGALAQGHCFVAYDGAAPAKGFRFGATTARGQHPMGDEVPTRGGVTLQIVLPQKARAVLLRNGQPIAEWREQTHVSHAIVGGETGVYRVEAHLMYQGRERGWIYSNPIYVRAT
jgi:hypothetical protein